MNKLKVFSAFYILLNFALFLYSYTQVDLSLTLSRASALQTIEKTFQNIGWYQRPVSTVIFVTILSLMFASYLYLLYLSKKDRITRKFFWTLLIITSGVLAFSYNAFSYDLFSYIFAAKIITFYHQNPYFHKALDFPSDPMLSFMRWTHNTYQYGPVALLITVPLSFIGAKIFILTFLIFKASTALFFLGTVWAMEKTSETLTIKNKLFPLVLFAFNPLVIIECLISSHNDIIMMFFALFGFYLFLKGRFFQAVILVILSSLTKFITATILIPIFLYGLASFKKIKISEENLLRITVLSVMAGFFYILTKVELQPWYFLWPFPFIAFLKPNRYVLSTSIFFTIGLTMTYIPVVSIGNYVAGGPYKLEILPVSIVVGLIVATLYPFAAKASVINRFFV